MTALKELQNYTFTSKYARWDSKKKRRETWKEAVDRVRQMMLDKYAEFNIEDDINWAYDMMQKKKVLGSQRMLQYGGKAALDKHARGYNCTSSYCDRLDFFHECFWLLLCGCGTGFSVQKHHIAKLPRLNRNKDKPSATFVIPDTIEGWADSMGVLLASFFDQKTDKFEEYSNKDVSFDFTQIRPKGSPLSSGVGKAPGPDGLINALHQVKKLLLRCIEDGQKHLMSIDAYDVVMHTSDAVLSGGVRRSSAIVLFSLDDELMLSAKTGNWMKENPQRARSNNSVLLLRHKTTFEEFENITQRTKEFGEPGFIWADDLECMVNPCQPSDALILTPNGISTIGQLNIGDEIWSSEGWTKVLNKWSTGINKVYNYKTNSGSFLGTEHHRILSQGSKIEVKDASTIDVLSGPVIQDRQINPQAVMDGLLIGDGSKHKASNNLIYLNIGANDYDYFDSEIKDLIIEKRPGVGPYVHTIKTALNEQLFVRTYDRKIPDQYLYADKDDVCSFLRGLYSANGSIAGSRVTLKAASFDIITQTQTLLSSIGIRSYYTTNKPKNIQFANGEYECKESYDLNITTDIDRFYLHIGFIQQYKIHKLCKILLNKHKRVYKKDTFEITSVDFVNEQETFDITVNNPSHTYWTNGCNVSNCAEVGMYCYDEDGNSGWQLCNLSSINCSNLENKEDFYERVKATAILGTLQAGFTDLDYLGSISEKIVRREALLGVSMTGMLEKTEITIDPKIQRKAASIILKTNEYVANKIGISCASRTTLIKPEGTASTMLGTSAGIHPHHSKRYLRRVQANAEENVYQFFKEHNPQACEMSVWSASGTDEIAIFPIEVPDGSKTKNQMSALEMLKIVKDTQNNWIAAGKRPELCVRSWLNHSVSNTIVVRPDEWDEVTHYIYDNRQDFTGVSLLPMSGDKDYPQAPFTTVYTSREIVREYGDAAIWCSGLIEDCLNKFDSLWDACDAAMTGPIQFLKDSITNIDSVDSPSQLQHILSEATSRAECLARLVKFANKYFKGDIKKLTYCLKDVYNWKLYNDLFDNFNPVKYTEMIEYEDFTKPEEEISCSGGACLI